MTIATESVEIDRQAIIGDYLSFLNDKQFPCIAAKAALARQNVKCLVGSHMACPNDDAEILQFLYNFVDLYRSSNDFFHSVAIIFACPKLCSEEQFDYLLWARLQALQNLDAKKYGYDNRVESDTSSAKFSFSIKEEAFYIIGLHAASSRDARKFKYPTLVFNPHDQFEQLKTTSKYEMMKNSVRKRDVALSGSINPMLQDFGESSEVYQYSGREYDNSWQCPLKNTHAKNQHNPSP
jgi:FPC/CPF motif-containing protein YcgG